MPLTRHGVTFTDAYLEAAAIANIGRAMLDTLEFYHPNAPDRLRIVNDRLPLFANLEPDAPEDGGVRVEFLACRFGLKPAEESDSASNPADVIEISNISGAVSRALALSRGSLIPWVVTGRVYASDRTSAPAQLPPVVNEVRNIQILTRTVEITCSFGDAGNSAFPGLTFKRVDYPTLQR